MAFDVHSLLASSTIQAGSAIIGSSTATDFNVASGDGTHFGAPQNVIIWPSGTAPTKANSEIVRVTAIATDTFTVTRAQEGTTALSSIAAGYQIANTITPKVFEDLETPPSAILGTHAKVDANPSAANFGGGNTIMLTNPDDTTAYMQTVASGPLYFYANTSADGTGTFAPAIEMNPNDIKITGGDSYDNTTGLIELVAQNTTVAGALTLGKEPVNSNEAATKNYVDTHAGGGGQTLVTATVGTGGTYPTIAAAMAVVPDGTTLYVISPIVETSNTSGTAWTQNNITIIGNNNATTVTLSSAAGLYFSGTRLTLRNLSITYGSGCKLSCTGDYAMYSSCSFTGTSTDWFIYFMGKYSSWSNCFWHDTSAASARVCGYWNSLEGRFTGNTIWLPLTSAGDTSYTLELDGQGMVATGNTFFIDQVGGAGGFLAMGYQTTYSGNTFRSTSTSYGTWLLPSTPESTFTGNTFQGGNYCLVSIQASMVFTGNVGLNMLGGLGKVGGDSVVSGNSIVARTQYTPNLEIVGNNTVVTGNRLGGATTAIVVHTGITGTLLVSNNTVGATTSIDDSGTGTVMANNI